MINMQKVFLFLLCYASINETNQGAEVVKIQHVRTNRNLICILHISKHIAICADNDKMFNSFPLFELNIYNLMNIWRNLFH